MFAATERKRASEGNTRNQHWNRKHSMIGNKFSMWHVVEFLSCAIAASLPAVTSNKWCGFCHAMRALHQLLFCVLFSRLFFYIASYWLQPIELKYTEKRFYLLWVGDIFPIFIEQRLLSSYHHLKHSPDIRRRLKTAKRKKETLHLLSNLTMPFNSKQHQKQYKSNKLSSISEKIYLDTRLQGAPLPSYNIYIGCDGSSYPHLDFQADPIFIAMLLKLSSPFDAFKLRYQFCIVHR